MTAGWLAIASFCTDPKCIMLALLSLLSSASIRFLPYGRSRPKIYFQGKEAHVTQPANST